MTTTTAITTKRAVGYVRVSTIEQAGERHSSLETQDARIRAFCEARGYTHVKRFKDVQSGRCDDRADYQKMLAYVMDGRADVVVVQFLDRFGRNPREILTRIWQLQEQGVSVVATDEDISEELVLLVRAGLAGAESKRTSERVRAYMGRAAEKGVHVGRAPYGFTRTRINDKVIWDYEPDEAAAVREMVRLVVEENLGYKAIADYLAAEGYPTREGKPWAAFTVQRILTNPSIAGTLVYGRKPKKGNPERELVSLSGFFPPIIAPDVWQRLQDRLSIRRENARGATHKSDYPPVGIARCGHCGGPMVGKAGALKQGKNAKPGERYRNYWCRWATQGKALCSVANGHARGKLEAAVLDYLGQYSDPAKVAQMVADGLDDVTRQRDRLDAELHMVERRLSDLERDFQDNLALLKKGILDEEDFVRANATRKQERADLENRRAALAEAVAAERRRTEAASVLPVKVRSFLEDMQDMDVRRAKAVLQTILKAVHVYRDNRIELEFRQ